MRETESERETNTQEYTVGDFCRFSRFLKTSMILKLFVLYTTFATWLIFLTEFTYEK